jgi:hypothetical protein
MTFYSILFRDPGDEWAANGEHWPDYARDLNLDQIVEKVTVSRDEYQLSALFERPLRTANAVRFRHEIMRDLEQQPVRDCIAAFAEQMRRMRVRLERMNKLYHEQQKQRWFVHAATTYCDAVKALSGALKSSALSSAGLRSLGDHLHAYVGSVRFRSLDAELTGLIAELDDIHYAILIKGDWFKVHRYDSEADYSTEVTAVFEKFRQGDVKDYRVEFRDIPDMNHVEAKVLEFVALLYPEAFARLERFCSDYADYLDPTIARFDREVQFYLGYQEFIASLKAAGLPFCYPEVGRHSKQTTCVDAFDLALAAKLVQAHAPVICNSFHLEGSERIFVVSGPNQGGKTTFARTVGQLHHLANLGLPVPGREARLFLADAIYTHFEREENIATLHGKLEDDLVRMHAILEMATPDSLVIMNEIFTSTTLQDAVFLAREMLERIVALDCLCVCVTFLDELASLSDTVVSMMSTVDPGDPTVRTYKVVRKSADGQAYAISLAQKYRLTFEQLRARIPTPLPTQRESQQSPDAGSEPQRVRAS